MTHPIVETFSNYAAITENDAFNLTPTPDQRKKLAPGISLYCHKIEKLIDAKPAFFSEFDYSWATNPENYTNPVEILLQHHLLLILTEISREHRDYPKLGNICIRVLQSQHINMEAVHREKYKYIVISTSMIRTMQTWAVVLQNVTRIGKSVSEEQPTICTENYLYGKDIERAARYRWTDVTPYLDYLIDTCASHRASEVPDRTFSLTEDRVVDEAMLSSSLFIEVAEMFFVCHELAHILRHDEHSHERSNAEELEADHWAASLFIVFQAVFRDSLLQDGGDYAANHALVLAATQSGPAIFFSIMHTILIVEQLVVAGMSTNKDGTSGSLDIIRREFALNRARMVAYQKAQDSFRLNLVEQLAKLLGSNLSYGNSIQQLDVISVACRMRIAERLKLPVQISLDRNLFPGSFAT